METFVLTFLSNPQGEHRTPTPTPMVRMQPHPLSRDAVQSDPCWHPADTPEAGAKEMTSSWALFIMIMLLIFALFTSYILQQRKIQAVHETVLSIFAGMAIIPQRRVWADVC